MEWILLAVPFFAGMFMAIQGTLNGVLTKTIGSWEGNLVVHCIATILILILVFAIGVGNGNFSNWKEVPWYGYLGGILNIGIIYGVMVSIPKLGAAVATTAIIVGQLGSAMIIDWLGLFGMNKTEFSWFQILGFVLLVVGGKIMLGKS